jgi:hypothetical protein
VIYRFRCNFLHLDKALTRGSFALAYVARPFRHSECFLNPEGVMMKTILMMAAVLALAGCEKRGTTSGADTSAVMTPGMTDSAGMTHSDSTMARDTAQK